MPNIPRHPHLTLDEWLVTHGRAPDARPIPFISEPDSGPDMRQSIAPEMLAQIVIKPVPNVVADPDEEPQCPVPAATTAGESTMTETDHDLAPTITNLPAEMRAEFLATGDPAEVIAQPQVLRMSPFFEALAKHFNLHAEADRTQCLNVPIEVIETLYAEHLRVAKAHAAGGTPNV